MNTIVEDRRLKICRRYAYSTLTLVEVGCEFDITGPRVRQHIIRFLHVNGIDGTGLSPWKALRKLLVKTLEDREALKGVTHIWTAEDQLREFVHSSESAPAGRRDHEDAEDDLSLEGASSPVQPEEYPNGESLPEHAGGPL